MKREWTERELQAWDDVRRIRVILDWWVGVTLVTWLLRGAAWLWTQRPGVRPEKKP